MITKEQIENAASKHGKIYNDPWNFECEIAKESFIVGVEWALQQSPYSLEDMKAFGKWLIEEYQCNGELRVLDDDIISCLKYWEEQK
jgi:hypothetical protein